jgi:hypothetical protein
MSKTICVMNDKGGVGKTTFTTAIAIAASADGVALKGVEVESEPRLSKRYPGEFTHIPVADVDAMIEQDASAVAAQFDPLFKQLAAGGRLIDLGANVVRTMMPIFEASGADQYVGEGENVGIVIVTTSNADALDTARKNATAAIKLMPASKRFLVVNEFTGKIPDDSAFIQAMRAAEFEILNIRHCAARSLPLLQHLSLTDLVDVKRETLMKLGVDEGQAHRDAMLVRRFGQNMIDSAAPIVAWLKA